MTAKRTFATSRRNAPEALAQLIPRATETVIASQAIAVGTLISKRPPHRTVRAAFPHTAPTLGA